MAFGRWGAVGAVLLMAAACAPVLSPTPAPTLPLIPPTITDTPIPQTPTDTPTDLPAPEDLLTPTALDGEATSDAPLEDPVAAEMIALAQQRLAQNLDLPSRRIRLVEIRTITWPDASLGCPQANTEYPVGPFEGYRLVLMAGDTEYVFHSDFDRLIPCSFNAEILPYTTAEAVTATENATAEATAAENE